MFFAFLGVGAIGTAAHYALLIALVASSIMGPVAASSAGFVLGAFVNYALNYRYTFRSIKRHSVTLPRFMVVALAGFVINSLVMVLLTGPAGLYYLLAQVLATGVVVVFGFTMNLLWTFGRET